MFNTKRVESSLSGYSRGGCAFLPALRRYDRFHELIRIIQSVNQTSIYLAAQSHVQVSFDTAEIPQTPTRVGTLRLLEAIRILGLDKKTRFYQASTSELYGNVGRSPRRNPRLFIPKPVRSGEAVCLLDYSELQGGIRYFSPQTAFFSIMRAPARRDIRNPENNQGPRRG